MIFCFFKECLEYKAVKKGTGLEPFLHEQMLIFPRTSAQFEHFSIKTF